MEFFVICREISLENEGPSASLSKPPDIETQPTIVQGPSAAIGKPPDVESQPTIVQQSTGKKIMIQSQNMN